MNVLVLSMVSSSVLRSAFRILFTCAHVHGAFCVHASGVWYVCQSVKLACSQNNFIRCIISLWVLHPVLWRQVEGFGGARAAGGALGVCSEEQAMHAGII